MRSKIDMRSAAKNGMVWCLILIGFQVLPLATFDEASAQSDAKTLYFNADAAYNRLKKNHRRQKYRQYWLNCIKKYQEVYLQDPHGAWAAAGMYKAGSLYKELHRRSYRSSDIQNAVDLFERLIKRYPKSRYRVRAERELQSLKRPHRKVTVKKKSQSLKKKTKTADIQELIQQAETPPIKDREETAGDRISDGAPTRITDLRYWSNPNYTRVVIDADKETHFTHRLLKKDPSLKKPIRLYVDLLDSKLQKDFNRIIPINDNLLKHARAGQYKRNTVRVVMDIKSFDTYKIFSLKNPFRIVIDVWGENGQSSKSRMADSYREPVDHSKKVPPGAIAKQLALGVRRIVIDPGHGGKDYGAPGCIRGVHEKYVVLSIAKKLASKIEKELNCEAVLTRSNNTFLTLEERTAIANTQNADLFISLHTNASRDRRAYGTETYFLNLATDDEAIRVAAKENATSTKNISDLQSILHDLMQNAKINESCRLATHVQTAICKTLKKKYRKIRSKGVKQAPFYVLLGAQMPAILVETAFISNPRECKRLSDPKYQDRLCDAIIEGIRQYIREINPTTFLDHPPNRRRHG